MANYLEHKDGITFHPGYYIKEIIEDLGITQEDFAKRLGTTPKNMSLIVRGEQRLSTDIAMKLSNMLGTSVNYWLNLQNAYDSVVAKIEADKELEEDIGVLKILGYAYFEEHFHLPHLPRKLRQQVQELRKFFGVASLQVLTRNDFAVSFRGKLESMTESNIVKANAMVQIAMNQALEIEAPKFDKTKFAEAVEEALILTRDHERFLPVIEQSFREAGVILQILPNLGGSKINGATKKMSSNIMLMVNDRRAFADSFWFTLFHEIGHIMHGDYGISFEGQTGESESLADEYAQNMLIDPEMYTEFIQRNDFSLRAITAFAERINRDPGIVLGRLENDGLASYGNPSFRHLKTKYKVMTNRG